MEKENEFPRFPMELLEKSVDDRKRYFQEYKVNHPIISRLLDEVMETINDNGSYSILFVFGPTGVGKTTLYNKIISELHKKEQLNLANDQGVIPFIGTRAIAPESGNFDWKDFYIRTLEELNEPLIHRKMLLKKEDEIKYGAYHNDKSTKAYRKSIENALKYRKTSIFLIDEAQHLAKIGSGKKLLNQMDVLKSLAAETETLIILFGTYGLQNFLNLSDQLSRRGKEFHFHRYRYDNKEERELFENILFDLLIHVPLKMEIEDIERELITYTNFFYERSLGCVGLLKDWIERTYFKSLNNGNSEYLSIDDFKHTALDLTKCLTIVDEIISGERQQEESKEKEMLLMSKLGMNTLDDKNEVDNTVNDKKKSNGHRRVGERKPKRDTVGVDKYA